MTVPTSIAWGFPEHAGVVVVSVDYCRSPEYSYPVAFNGKRPALQWLHDEAKRLGVYPT